MAHDLPAVFARLRPLFQRHAARAVVLHDEPYRYMLGSLEVRARDGYRTFFGGVELKKAYVSAHLMPVYIHPELLDGISPALKARMQGKSCFNFKVVDDALVDELAGLVDRGAARFASDGRL